MRIFAIGVASSMIVGLVFACGSDEVTGASASDASVDVAIDVKSADVKSDGATPAPDGVGFCCPPDEGPGCCMSYGGWTQTEGACGRVCDGMPVPSTPGWALVDDAHGCKVWSQPSGGAKCGQAIIPDASTDASDASDE